MKYLTNSKGAPQFLAHTRLSNIHVTDSHVHMLQTQSTRWTVSFVQHKPFLKKD